MQTKIAGKALGVMPNSVSGPAGRERHQGHRDQFRDRRARLLTCQPSQDRRVITPDVRHTSGRSQVNDPARQALVGHCSLVQQARSRIFSFFGPRGNLSASALPPDGHDQFDTAMRWCRPG